jgi:6-phosphofructokinase 1
MQRIAILTSGGDAPGMNAAIRAAVLIGRASGADVVGIERGYQGLLEDAFVPLGPADVSGILREGGTILGSARCKEFHQRDVRDRARAILAKREVDGVLVIGGNGSLTGALHLADPAEIGSGRPLAAIGVPASIDNDLGLTGMSIGVDTAMNTIVEACDKIADTATAHDRTFIIEVMGRDCGYLAMTAAIAVGADLALFPEAGKPEAAIVEQIIDTVLAIRSRQRRARKVLIIKAEGVNVSVERLKTLVDTRLRERAPDAEPRAIASRDSLPASSSAEGGAVPIASRDSLPASSSAEGGAVPIETRVTVLGHVVRGGRPSAFDRLLGSRLANVAVRALVAGDSHRMAAWMPPVELAGAAAVRSAHDPYCWLVELRAVLEETQNLLSGNSPLARWRAGAFDEIEGARLL